ncbi:GNAT family N-acetyltransferase [Rheinheimera sp. MMS21-TC3]|uniref:GNAT family N-acetyltransferase n=1 Tax=Rheinheimera sp. MMS21-TC3 TaxID=3072790 RepID=UPI0028C4F922|nr:GNAT family N-acetyltransferase [Rheinheimera sp. MMS21-TC3]WNO59488.1 GNAT family N-acetyltransferase [Rheinheimera sp. MMS21-TC3]
MQWHVVKFSELDTLTLYNLLQLRVDVFVVEQNCPYPELDDRDLDLNTRHIILKKGDKVIAYARVLAPGLIFENFPAIGRLCVSQTARRLGLGKVLVEKSISVVKEFWPETDIYISAQCYLEQFYQQLGFNTAGESYLEDDIPHITMILPSN